jgi:hypothetical protein
MDILYPRCAGLDVHKDSVMAAVRIAAAGAVKTDVRTFDTTTPGLLALSGWPSTAAPTSPWRQPGCIGSRSGTSFRMVMSRCAARQRSWPVSDAPIYHMLRDGTVYKDRGADHFNRSPEVHAHRLAKQTAKQTAKLGFTCTIAPIQQAEAASI